MSQSNAAQMPRLREVEAWYWLPDRVASSFFRRNRKARGLPAASFLHQQICKTRAWRVQQVTENDRLRAQETEDG